MKEYTSLVTIKFSVNNLEAENQDEYEEKLKAQYKQDYNIDLEDSEITEVQEA